MNAAIEVRPLLCPLCGAWASDQAVAGYTVLRVCHSASCRMESRTWAILEEKLTIAGEVVQGQVGCYGR